MLDMSEDRGRASETWWFVATLDIPEWK